MLDIRHIKHAIALAEHGNFARAADACHISQPAMTRSIQALERALGVLLFSRQRDGVELTEFGRILIQKSTSLVLAAKDIEREIALARGLEIGTLIVGVGPYAGAVMISSIVAKLHNEFPKLHVKIVVVAWKDLPSQLREQKIDLALGVLNEGTDNPDFESLALPKMQLHWICRSGHPLCRKDHLNWGDLFSHAFAGPVMPEVIEEKLLGLVEHERRDEFRRRGLISIESDSAPILISLISQSNAVTMMHEFMIRGELSRGEVVILRGLNNQMQLEYGVTWYAKRTLSSGAKAFLEIVKSIDF